MGGVARCAPRLTLCTRAATTNGIMARWGEGGVRGVLLGCFVLYVLCVFL